MLSPTLIQDEQLLAQYVAVRAYTEALCAPLMIEDYIPQPVPFASPPKWHLAHTTWFFEEFVLKIYDQDYQIFHKDFSFLFNSYYNGIGDHVFRADRGNLTRPGVKEIYAYRKYVNEAVQAFVEKGGISEAAEETIILGLNHEQQHQELLITDLKYTFGGNPTFPIYKESFNLVEQYNEVASADFVKIEEGVYDIGYNGADFHWDNEKSRHKVYLHEAIIAKTLVVNGDYLDFIYDGGYEKFEYWLDEGWTWVQENKAKAPLYWHKINDEWHYYTLEGLKKVDPDAILCHVNYFEAAAFAEWKQMRLPTEFEWEVAADQLNWGSRWEWTSSAYLPYPGFATAEGAIGEYNGKFMVNQKVLRGGSTATAPNHSRKTYRNFFQAHHQWQCFGVRLAKKINI